MNIYVGNLSFHAMDTDVKKLFSEFGEVKSVKVITDNYTRRSRGFAFVEMEDQSAGEQAITKLHNTSFMTKTLIVNESTNKNPRS
jgi:RNA recognition motif-containing protein